MTVQRLQPFVSTVFSQVTQLAVQYQAINLGQGFPDWDGPTGMLDAAAAALRSGHNQYPPGQGVPELRAAVAEQVAAATGLRHDPDSEVLVTVGATEAIAGAMLGLCEPGDEVVVIEPAYDSYAAAVALAGARRRSARLVRQGSTFRLDGDSLRAVMGPATRAVLLNTPHNPTGAVLPREDLELVAELAREFDAVVVSDEVYEHLVYDDAEHVSIATLPGMAERTLRVSSAAKTFNCTGWKIGWVTGPEPLVTAVRSAKQYLSYAAGTPLQLGVAHALRHEGEWVAGLRRTLESRRDRLTEVLTGLGLDVAHTSGTYFVTADPRPLGVTDTSAWCLELPRAVGVAAVPFAPFCPEFGGDFRHLARFAFCKRAEVLDEAERRLTTGLGRG